MEVTPAYLNLRLATLSILKNSDASVMQGLIGQLLIVRPAIRAKPE
jgi:hypothetical protein